MNTNTKQRIDAYLATNPGSFFTKHFQASDEFNNLLLIARDVVDGEAVRNSAGRYSVEDARVNFAEYGIPDLDIFIGDVLEAAQHDPVLAQTLTKRVLLDCTMSDLFDMELV